MEIFQNYYKSDPSTKLPFKAKLLTDFPFSY